MENEEHAVTFDYEQSDTADPLAVADQIRAANKLPELSPEEQFERQEANRAFLAECEWRDEQQRAESERKRTQAAAIAAEQERERLWAVFLHATES